MKLKSGKPIGGIADLKNNRGGIINVILIFSVTTMDRNQTKFGCLFWMIALLLFFGISAYLLWLIFS